MSSELDLPWSRILLGGRAPAGPGAASPGPGAQQVPSEWALRDREQGVRGGQGRPTPKRATDLANTADILLLEKFNNTVALVHGG